MGQRFQAINKYLGHHQNHHADPRVAQTLAVTSSDSHAQRLGDGSIQFEESEPAQPMSLMDFLEEGTPCPSPFLRSFLSPACLGFLGPLPCTGPSTFFVIPRSYPLVLQNGPSKMAYLGHTHSQTDFHPGRISFTSHMCQNCLGPPVVSFSPLFWGRVPLLKSTTEQKKRVPVV